MLGAVAFSLSSRSYPINSLSHGRFVMWDSETESSPIISGATNRDQWSPSRCLSKEPTRILHGVINSNQSLSFERSSNSPTEASPEMVNEVFGPFKTYFNQTIHEKGQQIEAKSRIE